MREYTEQEKQWLIDNYATTKQCDCAKRLMTSDNTVRRLAEQLGVYVKKKGPVKEKVKSKKIDCEQGDGYCLDCLHYNTGGWCAKYKKQTGALNRKKCFKQKQDEQGVNN